MKDRILNDIILALRSDGTSSDFLFFEKIDTETAAKVLEYIDAQLEGRTIRTCFNSFQQTLSFVVTPTYIRECHQAWLFRAMQRASRQGVFTPADEDNLDVLSGTSESPSRLRCGLTGRKCCCF